MSFPLSLNMQELGNIVRHWVHFDTLIANFNKQIQNARQVRDKYEQDIIARLKGSNNDKAVIQIEGGRIVLNEEKHTQPLSFKSLEELLHMYYRQRKPGTPPHDETGDILKFIKANRAFETNVKLKRTVVAKPVTG